MARDTINVVRQFEDRANTLLAATAFIDWDGLDSDLRNVGKWFQVTTVGHTPRPANGSTRIEDYIFQIDCYAHSRDTGTDTFTPETQTVWELADVVRDSFERVLVNVLDHPPGASGKVGELQFLYTAVDRVDAGAEVPGLKRLAVTIPAVFVDAT